VEDSAAVVVAAVVVVVAVAAASDSHQDVHAALEQFVIHKRGAQW
jgi:hypothetical protein